MTEGFLEEVHKLSLKRQIGAVPGKAGHAGGPAQGKGVGLASGEADGTVDAREGVGIFLSLCQPLWVPWCTFALERRGDGFGLRTRLGDKFW